MVLTGLALRGPITSHVSNKSVPLVSRFSGTDPDTALQAADQAFEERVPYPHRIFSLKVVDGLSRKRQLQYHNFTSGADQLKGSTRVVIGDLHGSWEKLFENLAMAKLITMPPETVAAFYKLSGAFKELSLKDPTFLDPATRSKAADLCRQFDALLPAVAWRGKDQRQALLLGDVVFDRGPSDYFTLALLNRVYESAATSHPGHQPIRIVYSNHDHKALKYFSLFYKESPSDLPKDHPALRPLGANLTSFLRTYRMVNTDPQLLTRMRALYQDHFKRQELAIYDPDTQSLLTHGANKSQHFNALLEHFKLPAQLNTPNDCLKTVSHLNQTFQQQFIHPVLTRQDPSLFQHIKPVDAFINAETEPAETGDFPIPAPLLKYYIHGHTLTHADQEPFKAQFLLGNDNLVPLKIYPKLEDVKTSPNGPTRINLNNLARYEDIFFRPHQDHQQLVNKVLVLA